MILGAGCVCLANAARAAEAIRALTDAQLDMAVTNSLQADAPRTAQSWIEEHPIRDADTHTASIRAALGLASCRNPRATCSLEASHRDCMVVLVPSPAARQGQSYTDKANT
ncbi:MAG: hypothetical protein ABIQ99_07535 [Thermoflexales bacterium]